MDYFATALPLKLWVLLVNLSKRASKKHQKADGSFFFALRDEYGREKQDWVISWFTSITINLETFQMKLRIRDLCFDLTCDFWDFNSWIISRFCIVIFLKKPFRGSEYKGLEGCNSVKDCTINRCPLSTGSQYVEWNEHICLKPISNYNKYYQLLKHSSDMS